MRHKLWLWIGSWCLPLTACVGAPGTVVGDVAAIGLLGAITPGHEIRQVYYVGTIDPLQQVPPSLYRITLRGEASILSSIRFESGWVKSELVDSLGTRIAFDDSGKLVFEKAATNDVKRTGGRQMWLFGPEGFREAPEDERLVVVMGSDPSAFFQAVGNVLGELGTAKQMSGQDWQAHETEVLTLLVDVGDEQLATAKARAAAAKGAGK